MFPFWYLSLFSVFWVFLQGLCWRPAAGLEGALDYFLFLQYSVPTVSSFQHGRVQVYVRLCNRFIWTLQVMATCFRVVMLSWVNWTLGSCWVLLVVPPWNDLAPCPSMAQLSPGTHTSSKRGLCSAGDTWEGDGRPMTMTDVTLGDPGMAQFAGLELNGIQLSRHQFRHCWLGLLV